MTFGQEIGLIVFLVTLAAVAVSLYMDKKGK
jgi:hypothetical protein